MPDKVKGRGSEDYLLSVTGRMNNLRTLIVSAVQIAIVKTLIRGDTSPHLAPAPTPYHSLKRTFAKFEVLQSRRKRLLVLSPFTSMTLLTPC